MTRVVMFAVVMSIALAFGGRSLSAHEGHDHKLLGTVTSASSDHVVMKDRDGKAITVKVTNDTKVKAKPALKVQDLKPGTRVVVTAEEQKDKSWTATLIEVGAVSGEAK